MPEFTEFYYPSSCGSEKIRVLLCVPESRARGIVQIAHGVAEHGDRYRDFMRFLAENGFISAAGDHLGHGKSVSGKDGPGFFAERDGWRFVVEDMRVLHDILRKDHPGIPFYLFGHSMGSFLARTYLIDCPEDLSGAVICGTGQQSPFLVAGGRFFSGLICRFKGPRYRSRFLNTLAFGNYNKGFRPVKTEYDWLSRNEESVKAYEADPLCGFVPSAGLFRDMTGGVAYISNRKNLAKMPKEIPVFFIAGERDPVGENGKGVLRAFSSFRKAGMKDVKVKLYPECRHEILNELNREEVMADILNWITEHEKKN